MVNNQSVIDGKPINQIVSDVKSNNFSVIDSKPMETSVFGETTTYKDTLFLNGMSMGPGWYMYVTFNGNRF